MPGLLPKLIVLMCCAVLYDCDYCTKDTCKTFQLNKKNLNKRLIGHGILETQGGVHHDCARHCFYYRLCKSFDFHRKERSCKLNNVSGESSEATFEEKAGAIFSDITEWPCNMAGKCGERPCSDKQKCVHYKDAFQCIDITCGGLPNIPNGWAKLHASDKFNDTASVYCRKGFFTKQKSVKCQLNEKWEKATCEQNEIPSVQISDCKDIAVRNPAAVSGTYEIQLWKSRGMLTVFCDMEADGGAWTIIQNRFDGSVEFYRNFSDYENGFGDINGEFWLGLKYIQELASQGATEIRLEMTRNNSEEGYEKYMDFKLEGTDYTLYVDTKSEVNSFSDDDDTFAYNNGYRFATYDSKDDDCAEKYHGAWWYDSCTKVNLNGKYCLPGTECEDDRTGLYHREFARYESLKKSRLLIRRK
ncbi:angiopoietin-related protein 2-like [Mercenaria mercenaria]|uniref:angiopoietin-related protein 2-like n=1 Tax=Mercenaria mercenaria TaxID=6596 RepID=UPI00234F8D3F|nr:angiopoietin-related protein 2-like [Mercenaria mercenaria]